MRHAVYTGRRDRDGNTIVRVIEDGDAHELPLCLDIDNHSPTGFEWGYGGSGPAQLALAILAHALGNDRRAARLHQRFKWSLIAGLDRDQPWQITRATVLAIARSLESEQILGGT